MKMQVVKNEGDTELGLLESELVRLFRSIQFSIRENPTSLALNPKTDLLVLLGSSWSVYDRGIREIVDAECSLIRSSAGRGVPILGICYGAQLISAAFGGAVRRSETYEIGWTEVAATNDGDPIEGRWMQWHFDTFTVPSGFDAIGQNGAGIQAIAGRRMLGVQFHPEANEKIVLSWIQGGGSAELEAAGISPAALLEQTRRESPRTTVASRELISWFLESIAQQPPVKRFGN